METTNALSLDCNKLTTLITDKQPSSGKNNNSYNKSHSDQQNRYQLQHRRSIGQTDGTAVSLKTGSTSARSRTTNIKVMRAMKATKAARYDN